MSIHVDEDAPSVRLQLEALRAQARADVTTAAVELGNLKSKLAECKGVLRERVMLAIEAGVDRKALAADAGLSESTISAMTRTDKPKTKPAVKPQRLPTMEDDDALG